MKKIQKQLELEEYSFSELSTEYQTLISKAKEAFEYSHSPYSKFPVGAALLLDNEELILGSNQENAAYPSGLCAERVALFSYGSRQGNHKIKALAIAVKKPIDSFAFPCGSCLQVMSEYEQIQEEEFDILIAHPKTDDVLISKGIGNLLPFSFKKENLI